MGKKKKQGGEADRDCAGKLDFRQWEFKLNYHKCSVEILPSVGNLCFYRDRDSSGRERMQ